MRNKANVKQEAFKLMQQGRLEEALELAEHACRQQSGDAETRYILGAVYGSLQRYLEAAEQFRHCIELQPGVFVAYLNLGQALSGLGEHEAAAEAYRDALALQPHDLDTRALLAGAEAGRGNFDEAELILRSILENTPRHLTALNTLADICRLRSQFDQAIDYYQRALDVDPSNIESRFYLGNCQFERGRSELAEAQYERVVEQDPAHVAALIHLGHCYKHLGRPDDARAAYRSALEHEPDNLVANVGVIDLLEREGRFDEAWDKLLPLVRKGEKEVDLAAAYIRLCDRYAACDEAVAYAVATLEKPGIQPKDAARLEYALGRRLDSSAQYDAAFEHYQQANQLKYSHFDPWAHIAFVDQLIATFNWEFFLQAPRATVNSERPVFIVGMPRSGTSLVEQILASHPSVHGAGELTDIGDAVQSMLQRKPQPYPGNLRNIATAELDRIANAYLQHLERLDEDALRVTDKQPTNFLHLGLIALAFPQAKIVHCRREPMDNCLSIYFQDFSEANSYASDLAHIGSYYRQYRRLMEHIQGVLPIPVFELQYETLVSDLEDKTRELLDFLELEWDERCLEFHKTQRFVATPSYDQVRKSLYTHAVNRWKNYEKHLSPLIGALS